MLHLQQYNLNIGLEQHWVTLFCNWDRCGWRGVISYHYLYSLLLEEKVEYSDFNYFSEDKKNPQNKHVLDENISCAGTYRCVNVFTCKILYEMDYLISDVFFSLF